MLRSLGRIHNPLIRSITSASAAFAIVTIIATVAIGLSDKSKDKAANKTGIYASLIALAVGAGGGLLVKADPNSKSTSSVKSTTNDTWQDWRDFKVVKKEAESKEITSFYLQPVDGEAIPDYEPGQYLTIQLDIPDRDKPEIRTYSLSDYPKSQDYYRLSIKREPSPKDLDVPPGVASNFMHDRIEVGSAIPCKPPKGKFYLEVENTVPAVFISNGVGITPMISMVKACGQQNPQRHVWFIHGARNGEYHAFEKQIDDLKTSYSNLHVHYRYSRPNPKDEGQYHSQGYVDRQLLEDTIIPEIKQAHSGSANAEYYLCGSPPFMDSLKEGLAELDVPEERVYYESFGGGKTKGRSEAANSTEGAVESAEVTFSQSNKTVTWTPADGSLLEFAEANGLSPDYSCRQGVCQTCTCAIESGEVEYTDEPASDPEAGSVLICISRPKTDKIVLDL